MTPTSPTPRHGTGRRLGLLATVLTLALFGLSLEVPLEVATGTLFLIVVLLGLRVADERFPLVAAGAATVLIGVSALLAPIDAHLDIGVINRGLSVLVIWITAVLVRQYKRADRKAAAEAARTQNYLDVVGVILVAIDAVGTVQMINRQGSDVLGYDENEIVGTNWFDRYIPAGIREQLRAMHARAESAVPADLEYFENPVLTREGRERLIAWHNTVLRDAAGRYTGTLSSGTDITDRRDAEQRLQASLKDLRDLQYALDQSAILAITDAGGRIRYANDRFCEISKYMREELLGQDHRIINSGYHPKEFFRGLWQTIQAGRIWRGEIRNRAKDGTFYWVDTTIVPLLDERGRPNRYMAIRNDITERKRAEDLLREQTTLARLGEMAAVVAHEVKNPLAGIKGVLQVIGARMPEDSRDRAIVFDVQERLDALNELLEDLLTFARPKAPTTALVLLRPIVDATVHLLKRDPHLTGVEVYVDGANPAVLADAEQLQRVLLNLLINAGQAMAGTGHIDVRLASADGWCTIAVQDAGPGMPGDVRARIFEPFFTTKHRGTGLGLPTAKRIVERHGGLLDVSCPPGGGTRVVVSLPLP